MFTPTKNYGAHLYWQPVINGEKSPDKYQVTLMDIIDKATSSGLFYNSDVDKYVKENNDFIPADAWEWTNGCEGGVMGMECYLARHAMDELKIRAADAEFTKKYPAGYVLGIVCVNGKRYTGAIIESYNDLGWCVVKCKGGKYGITFTCTPHNIEHFLQNAFARGWRKSSPVRHS